MILPTVMSQPDLLQSRAEIAPNKAVGAGNKNFHTISP